MPRAALSANQHPALLPARSPVFLLRKSQIERAFWLPAQRVSSPGRNLPLVSALMVTRCRPGLAAAAIECFQAQTWPHRELVVVDHGARDDLARHIARLGDSRIRHIRLGPVRLPLGSLRNRSFAEARGDWICQWDDDDLSHPLRIAAQMTAARLLRADACLLLRETLWRPHFGQVGWTGCRPWEHSMVIRRSVAPIFPSLRRGSDTPVVQELCALRRVALLDEPRLYVHIGHGGNVWNEEHFATMWKHATRHAVGRQAQVWLRSLGEVLPVNATLAALKISEPRRRFS